MAHKGVLPKAQPRTLRTIAEQKGTTPSGFTGGDTPGVPSLPEQGYKDVADEAKNGAVSNPASTGGKQPFGNLKGGH